MKRKIANDDIIAESLRSEPEFESEENYQKRGKVIGFTVTRPFEIRVRDINVFPKLIDHLIATANHLDDLGIGELDEARVVSGTERCTVLCSERANSLCLRIGARELSANCDGY